MPLVLKACHIGGGWLTEDEIEVENDELKASMMHICPSDEQRSKPWLFSYKKTHAYRDCKLSFNRPL